MDLEDTLLLLAAEAKDNGDYTTLEVCERSLAVERLDQGSD